MTLATTPATALPDQLPDLDWITDPSRVARLSQDFSWFSPVLKRELDGKRADIAVRPRTEQEIRRVVSACATQHIPLTLRGAEAMLLHHTYGTTGIVLELEVALAPAHAWLGGDRVL